MKDRYTVAWQEGAERQVQSVAELDAVLDEVDEHCSKDRPVLAMILAPNGNGLAIGLGDSVTVLNFATESENFASVGGDQQVGTVSFWYFGHHSEFSRRNTVPKKAGREAAREFLKSGTRPQIVGWEQV